MRQEKLEKAHKLTQKRLMQGRGNLAGRINNLKKLGVTTKEKLSEELLEKAELENSKIAEFVIKKWLFILSLLKYGGHCIDRLSFIFLLVFTVKGMVNWFFSLSCCKTNSYSCIF